MRDDRLFGDVVDPSIRLGSRRWYTLPLSVLVHALAIAALVLAPLMAADVLPTPRTVMTFFPEPAAPEPPPPPPAPARRPPAPETTAISVADPTVAPLEAPPEIAPEPPIDTGFAGLGAGGGTTSSPWGVEGGDPLGDALPPPPPPPTPVEPVPVGGLVVPPTKTRNVLPRYPAIAQVSGVSGRVIIEATIGTDGRVENARVLRSIPLLDDAALEAVRQWEFTPTLLNGVPVPVIMTVTVDFTIKR